MKIIKHITCFVVLMGFCTVMALAMADAIDRTAYPGCEIIAQENDVLYIKLNERLVSGTDMACKDAIDLIDTITSDGYRVVITNTGYTPISSEHFTMPITEKEVERFLTLVSA